MTFTDNEYLKWYMPRMRRDDTINLHSSGVEALSAEKAPPAAGDPWTMTARFEAALAKWLEIPAGELLFVPGATGGTVLALLSLVPRGQALVVEEPIYEPMRRQAERLGPVKRFSRRFEDGWRLPVGEIEELLGDDTGAVLITEPSNPSGTFADREDILHIADLAAKRGAFVLINEVYRGFTQAPSYHLCRDNIAVISSLSKLFGAYWARLGWLSAGADIVAKLRLAHLNLGMPSQPSAAVGASIMERAVELRASAIEKARGGLDTVDAWVRATPHLSWSRPQGPGFGAVMLPEPHQDDLRFAERLHEDFGVLVIPGCLFEAPGCIRISWLQSGTKLEEGLALIKEASIP